MKLTSYELSRKWFDFCFTNPEKITPLHSALYMFSIEHCNRLGWKEKFGLPTEMAKEAIGVKSWHTYIKAFNDLVEWGFFILIERSKNQYSSNIIALIKYDEALDEALDKALTKHVSKQLRSTYQSNDSIIKLITDNIEQITNNYKEFEIAVMNLGKIEINIPEINFKDSCFSFEEFWKEYPNKKAKAESEKKYAKLSEVDRLAIKNSMSSFIYDIPFKGYIHPMATTFINQKRWKDSEQQLEVKPESKKPVNGTIDLSGMYKK